MFRIIEHLVAYLFRGLIGADELIAAVAIAFALWCRDYAIVEMRRRVGYAVVLCAIGVPIGYGVTLGG